MGLRNTIRPGGHAAGRLRTSARRLVVGTLALVLAASVGACGDNDDPTGPDPLDLELVEGLYEVLTITFDPQGSAPAADVLSAIEDAGTSPTLNIGLTGNFQLFYRDPVSGNITTLQGVVDAREDGVDLVFGSQSSADQFLYPRRLSLDYDAEYETLSFSGSANVNRVRLQELFPEVYGEEPWTSDTIPGILTTAFGKTEE